MSVKIRLQRHGKKGKPFFWIVAARSKRDGKLLEKLGTYNPTTNPATIDLDIDGAVKWLQNGAQPTDTARAILSYKGAMLKNHLAGGVKKGALTEEQAEKKFNVWLEEKDGKISAKADSLAKAKADAEAKAIAVEKEINEKRMAAAQEAENDAIKAKSDAKAAEEAAAKAEEAVEEKPQTIDDVAAEAQEAVAKKVVVDKEDVAEAEVKVEEKAPIIDDAAAEAKKEVADTEEVAEKEAVSDVEASKEEE
jgi:small subunit ribosomal protein S16